MTDHSPTIPQVALIGLFVTALVTAQLTASKVIELAGLVMPGAALAYALTYTASDIYAELYGRRAAHIVVNVGFAMNIVLIALVYSTIVAPASPNSPVDPAMFEAVLGPSLSIVVASMAAYLVSQNWDVWLFHAIRDATDGSHLWLRNIASTATSQAIDSVLFVALGFVAVPALVGGRPMPMATAGSLIVGQYILKLGIVALDTPAVYAIVRWVR